MKEILIKTLGNLETQILQSEIALRLKKEFPATFRCLAKRLSLKKFSGLPLTILLISITSNLLLLFDFTEDAINSREFIAIDNFVALLFFNMRSEPLAKGFYYISQLCNTPVVITLAVFMSVYLLIKKQIHFVSGILVSLLGSGFTIHLGKNIFEIDRPHQYAYYHESFFSFPSGHATIAVAFYCLIFYYFIRKTTSITSWVRTISMAVPFSLLIGFSRLYLCVHYLSDVIAGYMLGLLWLLLSISLIEWQEHKSKSHD